MEEKLILKALAAAEALKAAAEAAETKNRIKLNAIAILLINFKIMTVKLIQFLIKKIVLSVLKSLIY